MADHNDRNQAPDDLYDEAAPRSIFAATWFRAVLVLIVLGVIGAVAVPYILDAMNAPSKLTAASKSPPVPTAPPSTTPPGALTQATPTPPTPATPVAPAPPPATSAPTSPTSPLSTPPTSPTIPEKPADREPMVAATTPVKPEATGAAKPEPKAAATKQAASAPAAPKSTPRTAQATASAVRPASGGQWFVQVGAFKDPITAKKVATKLRDDNYMVDEATRGGTATVAKATTSPSPASSGADQYDVIVSGQSPAELSRRLSAKGLTAEATQNGAVVRPSLPLRDAVTLSKDLAIDGSKVQVRRAGGAPAEAPRRSSVSATSAGGGETLHRVSVGGFADRATALATLKELEAKGYKPFLTRR